MNSSDFISPDVIIAEIANKSGDKAFEYASPNEYGISVQEALSELAFDSFFFKDEKIFIIDPSCLTLELPEGAFNIREIFGYSGDDCAPTGKVNIWSKSEYKNGLSKNDWTNKGDPFIKNEGTVVRAPNSRVERASGGPPSNLYFAGFSNGKIYLSPNCANLQKVVVRFNSSGAKIGDKPTIPTFFKTAIIDYCVSQVLTTRMANNPVNPALNSWVMIMNIYNTRLNKDYTGSWDKAKTRAKNLDKKYRQDLKEYFAKMY